jgi:hypothetical protein
MRNGCEDKKVEEKEKEGNHIKEVEDTQDEDYRRIGIGREKRWCNT